MNKKLFDNLKFNNLNIDNINNHFPDLISSEKVLCSDVKYLWDKWTEERELVNRFDSTKLINLSHGNPYKYQNKMIIKKMFKYINNKNDLHKYPSSKGDSETLAILAKYIKNRYMIPNVDPETNIIINTSTTQSFNFICQSIFRPHDVIIIPVPTYGIFCYIPEKNGAEVKFLKLNESDNWKLSTIELNKTIKETNEILREKAKKEHLDYIPRVVALLIINPSNPIGNYYSGSDCKLMKELYDVCCNNNVLIIEDLIYDGTQYKNNDFKTFIEFGLDNVVGLFGVSKSYGLASCRASFVVTNKYRIYSIRNKIFQNMDSPSILQGALLKSVFERDLSDIKQGESKLSNIYYFNLQVLASIINGIDCICDKKLKKKIRNKIMSVLNDKDKVDFLLKGNDYVNFVRDTIPDAGFFVNLDFSNLLGKDLCEVKINDEIDLLEVCIKKCGFKFLAGKSFGWFGSGLIGRVTITSIRDVIISFYNFKKIIYGGIDERSRNNC